MQTIQTDTDRQAYIQKYRHTDRTGQTRHTYIVTHIHTYLQTDRQYIHTYRQRKYINTERNTVRHNRQASTDRTTGRQTDKHHTYNSDNHAGKYTEIQTNTHTYQTDKMAYIHT